MPDRPPVFDDREDAVLTDAVAALVESERALAELEAARVVQFAAAMRVALERSKHRPRAVQEREMALRSIAAEIGVALRWNDRTVQRRLGEALQLVDDFPATLRALAEARIWGAASPTAPSAPSLSRPNRIRRRSDERPRAQRPLRSAAERGGADATSSVSRPRSDVQISSSPFAACCDARTARSSAHEFNTWPL